MTTEPLAVGERVLLRRWRAEDADAVFDACQDPEVQRWTTVPHRTSASTLRGS
jgi:RimJ/RimL family protein N-acetyltransferase